jgi:carbonic anhydrase/acetyltransferase-like protein (isoleucine patch superfamily)
MFKIIGGGPYCAVSYDSVTFDDLRFFMNQAGYELTRCDPDEFMRSEPDHSVQYINLVTQFPLREKICQYLDTNSLDRFSFFVCYVPQLNNIGNGVFVYPGVNIYPSAKIESDVIIHSGSSIAHGCNIGQGSFISGNIVMAGNANLGKWCWVGMQAGLVDNISIANHTTINARALVVKDIIDENTTYIKHIKS